MTKSKYEALRQAAEQFLASCKDGNVPELLEYYEEIFREALADLELDATPVVSQKPANLNDNAGRSWCGWCDRIVSWRCESRDDAVLRGCPPKVEEDQRG